MGRHEQSDVVTTLAVWLRRQDEFGSSGAQVRSLNPAKIWGLIVS